MAARTNAASCTVRATRSVSRPEGRSWEHELGPTVSWCWLTGTTRAREVKPTVGLMPTRLFTSEGLMMLLSVWPGSERGLIGLARSYLRTQRRHGQSDRGADGTPAGAPTGVNLRIVGSLGLTSVGTPSRRRVARPAVSPLAEICLSQHDDAGRAKLRHNSGVSWKRSTQE